MRRAKWGALTRRAKWEVPKRVDRMCQPRNSRPCPINKDCRNSSRPRIIKKGRKDNNISNQLLSCRKRSRSRSLWRPLCLLQRPQSLK